MTNKLSFKNISPGVIAIVAALGVGISIAVVGSLVDPPASRGPKQAGAAQTSRRTVTAQPPINRPDLSRSPMPQELSLQIRAHQTLRPSERKALSDMIGCTIAEVNDAATARFAPDAYDADHRLLKDYTGIAHAHKDSQRAWQLHFSRGKLTGMTEVDVARILPGIYRREQQ